MLSWFWGNKTQPEVPLEKPKPSVSEEAFAGLTPIDAAFKAFEKELEQGTLPQRVCGYLFSEGALREDPLDSMILVKVQGIHDPISESAAITLSLNVPLMASQFQALTLVTYMAAEKEIIAEVIPNELWAEYMRSSPELTPSARIPLNTCTVTTVDKQIDILAVTQIIKLMHLKSGSLKALVPDSIDTRQGVREIANWPSHFFNPELFQLLFHGRSMALSTEQLNEIRTVLLKSLSSPHIKISNFNLAGLMSLYKAAKMDIRVWMNEYWLSLKPNTTPSIEALTEMAQWPGEFFCNEMLAFIFKGMPLDEFPLPLEKISDILLQTVKSKKIPLNDLNLYPLLSRMKQEKIGLVSWLQVIWDNIILSKDTSTDQHFLQRLILIPEIFFDDLVPLLDEMQSQLIINVNLKACRGMIAQIVKDLSVRDPNSITDDYRIFIQNNDNKALDPIRSRFKQTSSKKNQGVQKKMKTVVTPNPNSAVNPILVQLKETPDVNKKTEFFKTVVDTQLIKELSHQDWICLVDALPHMTISMFEEFCSESVLYALKENTQTTEEDLPQFISVHEIIRLRIAGSLSNSSSPRSNNDGDDPDEEYMISSQELAEHRKQSNGAESSPSASNGSAVSESPLVTFLPRPTKPTVPICVYHKYSGLKLFDELRAPNPHQLTEPEISHAFYDLQDEARRYRGKTPVPMPKDGEKQHFEFICYDPLGTNEPAERERAAIFTAALNKYDPRNTVSRSLALLDPPCPGQMRGDGFNCGYVLLETAQNILQGLFTEKISQKLRSINQPIPLHVQHPVISYMDGTIPAVYFLQPGKINLFSENNFIEEVVAKLFMIKERALVFIPLLVNDGHWVLQLISNSPLRLYEKGSDIKQISPFLFNPQGLALQIRHPDYKQKMQLVRANWEAYFSSLAEKKVLYVHALGAYDLSLVDDKPVKPSGNIYLGIHAESSELFYVVYQNNIEVGRGDLPEVRQQFAVTTDNLPSLLKHKVFKNTIVAAAAKNKHAVVSPVVQIDDNYSFAHARDEQIKQDRTEQVAYRLCALMRKSADFTVWIAQILTNYPLEHYNNLSEDLRLFTPYITDVLCSAFEDEDPTIMQQLIRTNLHQYISDELTKHFKEHFVNLLSLRFAQQYPYLPEDNDVSTMWACVMTQDNNAALMQLVLQLKVEAEIVQSLGTLLRPRFKPVANTSSFAGFLTARPQVGKRTTTERLVPVAVVRGAARSQEEPVKVVPQFTAAAKVVYWQQELTTLHQELYRLYQDNQKNGPFLASVCNELLEYAEKFKDIRPTAHEQLNYRKVIQKLNEIRNQDFNVSIFNRAARTIVNKKNELIMKTLALLLLVPDVMQEDDVRKYLKSDSMLKNGNASGKISGPIYIADQVEKKLKDFQITAEERESLLRKP